MIKLFSPTPGGKIFNQKEANKLSLCKNLFFVAGHYKDVDDRVRQKFATDEYLNR